MRARWITAGTVGLALLVTAGAPAPTMPHPAPQRRAKTTDNAACGQCHSAIAAEWASSLHHASFTSPDFQRALPRDPEPFCKGCHAPETDSNLGVSCTTCHVTGTDTLAAPGTAKAPHGLVRTADFASDLACKSCHEFDFPDTKARRVPLAMQRTVSEHAGRTDTCLTCHMQQKDGHADHRFLASRDAAFVKSAVAVSAKRLSTTQIEVTLSPGKVGHAFPTGDLFRRIRVSVGKKERFLARHFASRQEIPGVMVRSELSDDRVAGGDRVIVLEAPAGTTRVRVVYERAEGPSASTSSSATVAGSIELFCGDF